ncbi:Endonuclease/Exonuclease/phosphatase family protein [Botrimarina colliarenosi]|uniref:Endonuclease/Exonuclease/phosphatase family protein n=1 Tax=Botrimarina colliarenosi TaxID=2528001 RepID=A0A5C6A235_9BACT|nr:endonuclease/exonuclease/phosphatase family protein [Botrimarina colliarenosi]TWT93476.1 Endonuclease/Exonuclease/phosphatase family protein [Botrimarina colliarenosi]
MTRSLATLLLLGFVGRTAWAADPPPPAKGVLRVATYNVALYRGRSGQLAGELRSGNSQQAKQLAEVIQRVRPDVLLLCEIDYAPQDDPPRLFAELYAAKPQAEGLTGIDYPHRFAAPVNTGEPSGLDLDRDGQTDGPADAWGYGRYPGQYGMAVLSRWPINEAATRTFQQLRWAALPDANQPHDPATDEPYYPAEVWEQLRLPSKSFWDVVAMTPVGPLHLLCSHPTPPVFDGPEDRNGCRNADEVRLLTEYAAGRLSDYFIDDQGRSGVIAADEPLVVLGDLNADPNDGDGLREAINDLIAGPRMATDPKPTSAGAVAASERLADLNADHTGDAANDTGDFGPDGHGNLRIDYALPSEDLRVVGSGVYWPKPGEEGAEAAAASDHRMVWVDVATAER